MNTYRRLFNHFLQERGLKKDKDGNDRSPYSLRHYALQTRLVKPDGKVNIYWLAENAGTSVEQLERFYLKNLAPSAAKVRNIQSFGDEPKEQLICPSSDNLGHGSCLKHRGSGPI